MKNKKLLLIDGSNLIFRAYYATEKTNLTDLNGNPINAIHSLSNMLLKMIKDENPDYIFMALDDGKSTFRHKMYEDYKGKRSETPENLVSQFPKALELYDAMGIAYGKTSEYEADDIIATYARQGQKLGMNVKIISGDKDLLQLVDNKITVLTPKIGFSKEINYTPEEFYKRYTFMPERFIEYKAIVGDSSDNIIGIQKVGDKTAKKLLNEYQTLNDLKANLKLIKGKVGENLQNNWLQVEENLKLVKLIDDIPNLKKIEELKFNDFNYDTLIPFFRNLGFKSIITRFENKKIDNLNAQKIQINEITNFDAKIVAPINFIYIDSMLENYHESPVLGCAIYNENGSYFLKSENFNQDFYNFLNDSKIMKITYDLKKVMALIYYKNPKIKLQNFNFDARVAMSLIFPQVGKLEIDDAFRYFGINDLYSYSEVFKAKSNPQMPPFEFLADDYLKKAKALSEIYPRLINDLKKYDLEKVFNEIEVPLIPVLVDMEITGITVDVKKLESLKNKYTQLNMQNVQDINKILKEEINLNSTKDLSYILFDYFELPTKGVKKTQSGYSTDINVINKLIIHLENQENITNVETNAYHFLKLLKDYRKYTKLTSTYLDGLKGYIYEDSKIHTIFMQTLAETGRLSSTYPNIQNIPIRDDIGREIRSLFTASKGNKLMAYDYSQIELRVMAEMSQDARLIKSFDQNLDVHKITAQRLFNKKEISNQERAEAKTINFGVMYGMSAYGLAKQIDKSNQEAAIFIEKYFAEFPGIAKWIEKEIKVAEKNGYVTTYYGRRRNIQGFGGNFKEQEIAKRVAINTPIQGTAADIIKIAMIKVYEAMQKNNLKSKMLLQIHDELIFDVIPEEQEKLSKIIETAMTTGFDFRVPLKIDGGVGDNWLELK